MRGGDGSVTDRMTTAPADEEQTQVNQELGSCGAFRTGVHMQSSAAVSWKVSNDGETNSEEGEL